MPVPMRKLPTEEIELVSIGDKTFHIPIEKARAMLVLLKGEEARTELTIPSEEVFKNLDLKYSRPGVALRGARGKEDMSQVELAEKLGVTQSDLSKMEHGKRPIGKKMAKRLSKILDIDYRVFL